MANHNDSIGSGSPEVASSPAGDQQPQQLNQLNSSVDSGIAVGLDVDSPSLKLQQRLQQCQRILQVLRRDEAAYQLLRDRLSKISNKKTKKKDDSEVVDEPQSTCNVCCGDLDISSAKNYVKCRTCEKSVCRGLKCADWHPKDGQWECQLCHNSKESLAHTSSWVAEQMSFNQHKFVYPMRARSEVYIPIQPSQDGQDVESTIQFESVSQIGIRNHMNIEERAKIREYVEEIVAEMLGGNLDKIKVGQLSKSENYLPAIVNGHSNNNNNSNSNNNNNGSTCNINGNNEQNDDSSQTRLRTLIETIIAETLRNSALGFNTGASASVSEISLDTRTQSELNALKQRHRTEHYFEPKIYQDLLATAVLNKIADTEENSRRRSLISESTPDLSGHNNIDENYNAEALSTTSGSSIEPRSDCSLTDNELVLNTGKTDSPLNLQAALERESVLSDYIAAHMVPLPDFSASVTESEDDNGSVTSSMIADGTWEDNWLFKKKQHSSLQSSATPSSIGMLVPAPRENVRAQIGDRTADEVSDLSEMGSDVEETSLDINDRLLNKHLIGGQNTKLVLDELIDRTSLISHTLPEEHEPAFTETTNPLILQTQPTEVPSQFIEPPPPTTFQDDQDIEEPILIAGSIAEREVKKWYNAVEMPNNPYAPEALKQRISGTQERCMDVPNISPSAEQKALALKANADDAADRQPQSHQTDYKRYSRDYYINNNNNSTTLATSEKMDVTKSGPEDVDIVINEVNAPNAQPPIQPPHGRNSVSAQSTRNVDAAAATVSAAADLSHWTLSTPVRRSSSLKFINTNNNSNKRTSPPTTISNFNAHHHVVRRPSTSASHYCDTSLDDIDDFDIHSQRSWRSLRPARSTLSLHSNASGMSFGSSVSKRSRAGPTTSVLTQFEKQLLHKDLKRNSFRAVSATSKDFVMNPLFEGEARATSAKLTLRPDTTLDEQGDSGVDSCLNGFSGTDTQYSNNSLLF